MLNLILAKKELAMTADINQALQLIYQHTNMLSTEIIPLELALNRIIGEDVIALHNLPPFDNSAMDGYGVRCDDASKALEVSHTILAGDEDEIKLQSGFVCKIMTGAKIPNGCDAVVPFEDVKLHNNTVVLPPKIKPLQHIRAKSEDIKAGDILIHKGTLINAYKITLLTSQGCTHISVFNKPRIGVFASGSELKMHFQTLQKNQIYNTNTPTLIARMQELGCDVSYIKTASDDIVEIKKTIQDALKFDFIITSGGASHGEADLTKEAFAHFDMKVFFDQLDIKPGKPTIFGKINNTMILNLPGNPLAASLNCELFARAIVFALSGREDKYIGAIDTVISSDIALNTKRATLLPGYFNGCSFKVSQKYSSGMIKPLAASNGFIIVDKNIKKLTANQKVKFIPITYNITTKSQSDIITLGETR